ncbi:uncharacterized protein LOC111449373 isoform X2 [Cucurbita moschata]|uniref:Uncharacterized protein LOC111449373 isoform X2 n=1 Tax=Cucurbita moschata TaxID=3662 RepID=A0A6J1FZS1_CUCMO|nr:uncharacterized protein LOC111449373 isoform X2 [Cucurbita moschata]
MRTATGENPSSTPPKLSLFSFPRQPLEPPGMATPPLHASISVPFHWEEAPGKPKPLGIIELNPKPKSARTLDLPLRLFADAKVAHFASPTIAADDPVAGRDRRDLSFRFPDSWAETATATETREGKDVNKENVKRGPEISLSAGGADDGNTRVKITRLRIRRNFIGTWNSKSHIACIYGSLKQVLPWRRKHDE